MSSLFGSMGGGPPERPPAIFGSATPGQSPNISNEWRQTVKMLPMTLVRTTDPVWPADEVLEEWSSREAGHDFPPLAPAHIADQMAGELRVDLPDRLLGYVIKLSSNPFLATAGYDYYGLCVPTTFSAQPNIIPRRLRLQLTFEDATGAEPQRLPIACQLYPGTEVATEITNIGQFQIDLGQAFKKTMWVFAPGMPDLLTARTGGSLDLKRVRARVQAAGLNSHRCDWRIADTKIAYVFNPACIVQVPKGAQLAVNARLHVEARKKVALIFYRTYFETSEPRRYLLADPDGQAISPDNLSDGSEVTLRLPGALYSDDITIYSRMKSDLVDSVDQKVTDVSPIGQPSGAASDVTSPHDYGLDIKSAPDASESYSDNITAKPASLMDELSKLASMLDSGLLTREEFDQLKAKLIAGS